MEQDVENRFSLLLCMLIPLYSCLVSDLSNRRYRSLKWSLPHCTQYASDDDGYGQGTSSETDFSDAVRN